ncbi:hypothetical protein ABZ615_22355 [Streptomyces sp. NPDC007325]|uniref:hypothetical protein n=1 Tax=Streptomyces sp. NPDC007325 TaxID=3154588 RepID=UPI0033DD40EC
MLARTARPLAAVSGLAVAGLALAGGAPAAYAAPGDNGDVKIHEVGTPFADQRNESKVCSFYLAAFNFDSVQRVRWTIAPQPDRADGPDLAGSLRLAGGTGHTDRLALPDGTYRLTWTFAGAQGAGKNKVFQVDCPDGGNGAAGNGVNGTGANGNGNSNGGGGNGANGTGGNSESANTWNGGGGNGNGGNGNGGNGGGGSSESGNSESGNSWNGNGGNGNGGNGWNGGGGGNGQRPPQGPVGAGGGGSAEIAAAEDGSTFGVGAAVAAGLAGTVGLVLIRRSRRRHDGAA